MSTFPNGPYHFYNSDKLPPIVCEMQFDYVWEAGDGHYRHVSTYKHGRFVRLQEVTEVIATPLVIRDES